MKKDGIFNNFVVRLKEKFDVSGWERTREVWDNLMNFQAKEDEETKKYLMRFQELESSMRNVGN